MLHVDFTLTLHPGCSVEKAWHQWEGVGFTNAAMVFDMLVWCVHRCWLKAVSLTASLRQSVYHGLCAVVAAVHSKKGEKDPQLVPRLLAKFNMPTDFKLVLEDPVHEWNPCPPQLQ